MQLPNKLYSYKDSTLSQIPIALKALQKGPTDVTSLFVMLRPYLSEATDFLSVMDCLYALRAVNVNDKGEIYVCL